MARWAQLRVFVLFKAQISLTATLVAVALMGGSFSSPARAEDDCLAAPKGAAPLGSHWYYRTDRVKQVKCWHLTTEGQPNQTLAGQQKPEAMSTATAPQPATAKPPADRPRPQILGTGSVQEAPSPEGATPRGSPDIARPAGASEVVAPPGTAVGATTSAVPWVDPPVTGSIAWPGAQPQITTGTGDAAWPAPPSVPDSAIAGQQPEPPPIDATSAGQPEPPSSAAAAKPMPIQPPALEAGVAPPQSGKLVVDKDAHQMPAVSPPVSDHRPAHGGNLRLYVAMARNGIAGSVLFADAIGLLIAGFYVRYLMRRLMAIAVAQGDVAGRNPFR